ncbi:MAG: dTDP-4-dehydrorhamnose 3,5-epimerase [Vicingaceae bacterium]
MEVEKTTIDGLLIIRPRVFPDERGYFFEAYNEKKLKEQGFDQHFVQDNISKSSKNVLRGLHFQNPPHAQGKLVQVIRGAVLDIAVDIRKSSPTYGEHFAIELSDKNNLLFFIPPGFAHGFLTLEDNTIFSYKCTALYNKESEGSILWNDKNLAIDWNVNDPIISEKDQLSPAFNDFKSQF